MFRVALIDYNEIFSVLMNECIYYVYSYNMYIISQFINYLESYYNIYKNISSGYTSQIFPYSI